MSARALAVVAVTALVAAMVPADIYGQTLSGRLAGLDSDRVSFRFPTNPDVRHCDGAWTRHRGRDWSGEGCWNGPAEVRLDLDKGSVTDIDVEIVRAGSEPERGWTALGMVEPEEAADYLLALAKTTRASVAEDAIAGAAMVDERVVIWPKLLEIARDQSVHADVREGATFWLGQASADQALAGLKSIVDDDPDIEVRQAAVFAISQREGADAVPILLEIAEGDNHPEVRRSAFFWLAQHEDARVLEFFERVLTRGGTP